MANSKKTLVQRIALDGGKDIEKELKELGEVGEAAFKKLKDSAENVAKAGVGLNGFFAKVRADLVTINDAAKKLSTSFNNVGSAARELSRNVVLVSAAVTGVATALFFATKSAADFADEQNKAAQAAGLNIKEYGRLQFAFEQGNISAEEFTAAMKPFNKAITAAAKGSGPAADVFKRFGVNIKDSAGNIRSTEAILADLADGFAKVPDSAAKSAAALTLFGRAGAKIIPVLDDGGTALRSLGDDAERIGRVVTVEQAKLGDAFGDALNEMVKDIIGIKNALAFLLAPAFTEVFKGVISLIDENRAAILAFGKSLTDQVVPFIKDLVAILNGNDAAVINKNLLGVRDTIVAIGGAAKLVSDLISTAFTVITNAIQPLVDVVNAVIDAINNAFGTKISHVSAAVLVFSVVLGQLLGVFKLVGAAFEAGGAILAFISTTFGTATGAVVGFIAQGLLLAGLIRTLVDDVLKSLADAVTGLGTQFTGLADAITGAFKVMVDSVLGFFKQVIDGAKQVVSAVSDALGLGSGDAPPPPPGFATGGSVRGAGTGTSDSILARLSNGEFIMRAKAVRKLGLSFLHRLNSGSLPGFAAGGLVGSLPAFAGGGSVSSGGRPLNLTIGGEIFEGLMAPDNVADKLVRYATTRNVRRSGRTPSWKQ